MAIIVQRKGERAEIISESSFPQESDLQHYVYENPEVLPISDIKENAQFTVLDKETPVGTGYLDILGVDNDGEIYIVETKLFKNPDKRRVLAQVLDYGAAIWSTYQDSEGFLRMLEERLAARGESLDELLERSFGEASEIEAGIKECIQSGGFRFIIMMDQVPSELKDLIQFVNRNSNFSVYAVELKHYEYEDGALDIFVPHVFGAEERKRGPVSSGGRQWDEVSFFQDLEEKTDARTVAAVRKLYEFSKELADEISWGRGRGTGSFNPKFYFIANQSLYSVWTNGRITINFGWLISDEAEAFRERLRAELKAIPALSKYIPDAGLKSPGIPAPAWVPVCDQLLATLKRVLAEAGGEPGQTEHGTGKEVS